MQLSCSLGHTNPQAALMARLDLPGHGQELQDAEEQGQALLLPLSKAKAEKRVRPPPCGRTRPTRALATRLSGASRPCPDSTLRRCTDSAGISAVGRSLAGDRALTLPRLSGPFAWGVWWEQLSRDAPSTRPPGAPTPGFQFSHLLLISRLAGDSGPTPRPQTGRWVQTWPLLHERTLRGRTLQSLAAT